MSLFQIRYLYLGEPYRTVINAWDEADAVARFGCESPSCQIIAVCQPIKP